MSENKKPTEKELSKAGTKLQQGTSKSKSKKPTKKALSEAGTKLQKGNC